MTETLREIFIEPFKKKLKQDVACVTPQSNEQKATFYMLVDRKYVKRMFEGFFVK